MTVIVVTDSRKARSAFATLEKSRTFDVEFSKSGDYRGAAKRCVDDPGSFLYFDATGIDQPTLVRRVKSLTDQNRYNIGIVDPQGSAPDIAQLFQLGIADYVGKKLMESGISTARFKRVVEYAALASDGEFDEDDPAAASGEWTPSGTDWQRISEGQEYTFVMVYAGIDLIDAVRRKSSEAVLKNVRAQFQSLFERHLGPYHGHKWMWKDDDGLFLVPFDGRRVDVVIPAMRIMLNRILFFAEEFAQFEPFEWRVALHLGDTTFHGMGKTGAIVSEDVNYVFHLGERFLDAGEMAVTDSCYDLLAPKVQSLFEPRGKFESVPVHTLRHQG